MTMAKAPAQRPLSPHLQIYVPMLSDDDVDRGIAYRRGALFRNAPGWPGWLLAAGPARML